MNILLTGAFGNIGNMVLNALLERGHQMTCFDLPNKTNQAVAAQYTNKVEMVWGDLRNKELMSSSLSGKDAVVHIAAMIPPFTETNPELSWDVNVNGTEQMVNLIAAMDVQPLLVFTSSFAVFGFRQSSPPPRTVDEPVVATDNYSKQKIACEQIIQQLCKKWCILRLGAATDERMVHGSKEQAQLMLALAANNRIEFIHPLDVALAIANAIETPTAHNKIHLIGGGKSCQTTHCEFANVMTGAMGLTFKPSEFGTQELYADWADTSESQRLLQFQKHSIADLQKAAYDKFKVLRFFVKPLSPLITFFMKLALKP